MLNLFNKQNVSLIPNIDEYWKYIDSTQQFNDTPDEKCDAVQNIDLRIAEQIKEILENQIGPEEGESPVQMQNWDWNDDNTRPVFILRSAFKPEVLGKVQNLLAGEFEDFRVIIFIQDTWESDIWAGIALTSNSIAIQKQIVDAYAIVA